MTMIPIVIGAVGTVIDGLVQEELEIRGRGETIQITEESWRFEETCCYSDSSEKPKE